MLSQNKAKEAVLLIRSDANSRIGSGHLMRSLALVHAWQDYGGRACAVIVAPEGRTAEYLDTQGVEIFPLDVEAGDRNDSCQTLNIAEQVRADWIVADGYAFGSMYQAAISHSGRRLLIIDDFGHAGRYSADIVLNVNVSADEKLYRNREIYTRLLLGTDYALLRREFLAWPGQQRSIQKTASRILVTLGGADPDNLTSEIIRTLDMIKDKELEVIVVVGDNNPHCSQIEKLAGRVSQKIEIKNIVRDMPSLIGWADLVISGGGGTCWELAHMGLPNIIIAIAENQIDSSKLLDSYGVSRYLGISADFSRVRLKRVLEELIANRMVRQEMSHKGRELVDGLGAARVVQEMLDIAKKDVNQCSK